MDCIGAFSEVLYNHPNILSHILPIITSAIRNPEVALCATMALKDISRDCIEVIGPFAQNILTEVSFFEKKYEKDVIETKLERNVSISQCQQLLSSNELKNGECIRLMVRIVCSEGDISSNEIITLL